MQKTSLAGAGLGLRAVHRASGLVLVVFVFIHIGNHLSALHSIGLHLEVMSLLRRVYRHPVAEVLLLMAVLVQVVSGLRLVARGWALRSGRVAWLQAIAGMNLAFFLLVHVGAVLLARGVLGLDTNFYFAAAGFHVSPWGWFFAPYYALAVLAVLAHLACAWYWHMAGTRPAAARWGLALGVLLGVGCATLITLSLAGMLQPFDVPSDYTAVWRAF